MSIVRDEKIEPKTHEELVHIGYRWLLRRKPRNTMPQYTSCRIAFKEKNCLCEIPDVVGFNSIASILVECKTSRADFLADKKKWFRSSAKDGIGQYRYFLCNKGIVSVEDLPDGWGLLESRGRTVRIVKDSEKFDIPLWRERSFLVSMISRIAYLNLLDVFNDQRLNIEDSYWFFDEDKALEKESPEAGENACAKQV